MADTGSNPVDVSTVLPNDTSILPTSVMPTLDVQNLTSIINTTIATLTTASWNQSSPTNNSSPTQMTSPDFIQQQQECHPAYPWIWQHFGQCVMTSGQAVGFSFGLITVLIWLLAHSMYVSIILYNGFSKWD